MAGITKITTLSNNGAGSKAMETNKFYQADCMEIMSQMQKDSVHLTLTDIPYGEVNRGSNGLRTFDKGAADVMTFDLTEFLSEVYRITSGTVIIFCGQLQVSEITEFFKGKNCTYRMKGKDCKDCKYCKGCKDGKKGKDCESCEDYKDCKNEKKGKDCKKSKKGTPRQLIWQKSNPLPLRQEQTA